MVERGEARPLPRFGHWSLRLFGVGAIWFLVGWYGYAVHATGGEAVRIVLWTGGGAAMCFAVGAGLAPFGFLPGMSGRVLAALGIVLNGAGLYFAAPYILWGL